MTPRFDKVLVIGPEGVTGGPEACHQLAHSINVQGGVARMVYTGPFSTTQMTKTEVFCKLNPASHGYNAYQRYEPQVDSHIELTKQTLLLFPEHHAELTYHAHQVTGCPTACWWLGVPEGAEQVTRHDSTWQREFFSETIHLYQSQFALKYLRLHDATMTLPLFDYTDQSFIEHPLIEKKLRSVAYFPMKGRYLAEIFFEQLRARFSDIEFVPIINMTKSEVVNALASALIYIDFGHQPGKDRIPREAAAVGTIVLLHKQGAARFYEDAPLDKTHKFYTEDIDSGVLLETVTEILANPTLHRERQMSYRQQIKLEKEEFDLQVRRLFFI